MKKHNRTEYRERPTLEGFLKIVQEIRLDGLSIFTFAVNALIGAIVIPLVFKLAVETLAELAHRMMLEHDIGIATLFENFQIVFQYLQWPLFMAIVAVYWFRCNVKAYNYHFTQFAGVRIRKQLESSNTLICPRCGKPMRIQRFTETIREKTGEHEESYIEWEGTLGQLEQRPVMRTRTVWDFSDVKYNRYYAVCENQYCMYEDKRPSKNDVALYKFSEMPYKISDTVNYAVRTKATTNLAAGNIKRYSHGISLCGYLVIGLILAVIAVIGEFSSITFIDEANLFNNFLVQLAICEGIVLVVSILVQVIVHLRKPNRGNNHIGYVEIKNETKDGVTVVLPDGSEFYAETDHRIQKMYDDFRRSKKK